MSYDGNLCIEVIKANPSGLIMLLTLSMQQSHFRRPLAKNKRIYSAHMQMTHMLCILQILALKIARPEDLSESPIVGANDEDHFVAHLRLLDVNLAPRMLCFAVFVSFLKHLPSQRIRACLDGTPVYTSCS